MSGEENPANIKRYNQFSEYLKQKFGVKVYKITLDAGFSCPNRQNGNRGCIYCDAGGSFSQSHSANMSIKEQLDFGAQYLTDRFKAVKYMSYFQSFSNTYKPVEELKEIYDAALNHTDIVGISIGTRPDCVDEEKLDLIAGYKDDYETWIEYGLQSMHNKTLERINRGHDFECFLKTYEKTKARGINTCVHIIFGLWETHDEMMQTVKELAKLDIDGLKLHMICGLRGTELTEMYKRGEFEFMSEMEYVNLCCDAIELLPPHTTLHRIAGSGLKSTLVEPKWIGKKFECLNKIDAELIRRNSWQGKFYEK